MRTVDLFAGCGGLSLGFQNAGFEIIAAFDFWHPAIEVYRENFQHPIFAKDLSENEAYKTIAKFNPDLEQMIGNAVPVKLAEYVARCILEYIDRQDACPTDKKLSLFPLTSFQLS